MDKLMNNYNFTEFSENIASDFKNEFRILPRETALAKYEKIKKSKGSSKYPHSMIDLFNNCGFIDIPAPDRLKEKDILLHLNSLPTKDEITKKLMTDLYSVYKEYKTPGQYMERIVKALADDEFKNDSTRLTVLKQFLKHLQNDCESVHPGINSLIKDIKKAFPEVKKSKNISEITAKLDENIFLNTKMAFPLSDDDKILFKSFSDNVISLIDTKALSESDANTYSLITSILKNIQHTSFITANELSQLKDINKLIYKKGEETKVLQNISTQILKTLAEKQIFTEKQSLILSHIDKTLTEAPDSENQTLIIQFSLMFKNIISENEQKQTKLKTEQIMLLQEAVKFINKNAENISLPDKAVRIKIINKEFLALRGNICSEALTDEIKLLISNIDADNKKLLNNISAFLTDRISLNREDMQLIDSLYAISKKATLDKRAQELFDEFINLSDNISRNRECEIPLTNNSKDLLKTVEDLATCTFRMNGATREALYLFAFAFGLKAFKNDDINYDKNKDIEKFFWDCYNDTVCRYLEVNSFIDNSSLPTGEGINYKNFAEVIFLYFLSSEDSKYSKYEKYTMAINCINKCKSKALDAQQNNDTYFYKNKYWEEILTITDLNSLEEFICQNFYIPQNKPSSAVNSFLRSTGIEKSEIETILASDNHKDEPVRLTILKRFIEYGFVGDGPITGVSSFVNKTLENKFDGITDKKDVCAKITDESIDRFKALNIKDEHKLLARISTNLASGEFVKYSTAKENLFKFLIVFGMRLYKDSQVSDYKANLDAEIFFSKFFDGGINYENKLDTICAYYLANDVYPLNKKLNTIQYRLKQAFSLYRTPDSEASDSIHIENKKEYFWNTAVSMDEESFKNYVLTNFSQSNNTGVNNIAVMSDEITAYEVYNDILNELDFINEEQDIRSTLLDDIQTVRHWIHRSDIAIDREFLTVLYGMEKMVNCVKNITKKNITRNDLIILNYYKIIEELHRDRDLEYVYDYAVDYINYDLERARFQPLNPKNFFDLFIICLLYIHCMDTPLF